MIKKSIVLLVCTVLLSTTVYASTPTVWAYDAAHSGYEASIVETVEKHIPSFLIDDFNLHGGQIVIDAVHTDNLGKAGYTNGEPRPSGWYDWPQGTVYMNLTPTYGLHVMQGTVLHEFGHVLDMSTGATDNSAIISMISSEIPAYNDLEIRSGYMIPSVSDAQELFAQVFAAIVSNNDGTVNNSQEILDACPQTEAYVKSYLEPFVSTEIRHYSTGLAY